MLHLAHWTLLPCRRSTRVSTDGLPTDSPPAISPHSTLPVSTLSPPTPRLQGSAVQAPGFGLVVNTALRGLSAISERLTDFALQYAPADASPGVVRVAVNAGMLLLALSFVKSLLSVSGSEVGRLWAGECTLGDGNGGNGDSAIADACTGSIQPCRLPALYPSPPTCPPAALQLTPIAGTIFPGAHLTCRCCASCSPLPANPAHLPLRSSSSRSAPSSRALTLPAAAVPAVHPSL